jgi:hypothetical protein
MFREKLTPITRFLSIRLSEVVGVNVREGKVYIFTSRSDTPYKLSLPEVLPGAWRKLRVENPTPVPIESLRPW